MKVVYFTLSAGKMSARYLLRARPGGDLAVINVPDDAETVDVLNLVNLTGINAPTSPTTTPELDYAQLGRGKLINLVKRGRPAGSGEGRDTPITWRTTAERSARLAAAAEYAQIPKSQALDEATDAWVRRHQPAKR